MTFTINNGRRAEVSFGVYRGRAGVSADWREVAFLASLKDFRDPVGGGMKVSKGEIGGAPYAVTDVRRSETVEGMIVLTVTAVISGIDE